MTERPFDRLEGVLFFPVTPFDARDRVDAALLEQHVAERVGQGAGGVFAACGTGEFHALALDEVRATVDTAVRATAGRVPVIAGTGGPVGHAVAAARAAEEAGADGLLVLPPYLVTAPQEGLLRYIRAVAAASALPLVVYHRGSA
ncbi:MAG: dihydrodipicolinate synthase family protein, partial [Amnibacterium sp.]